MTRTQLRQAIARNLRDLELGVVASMSGSNIRSTAMKRFEDDAFNDGEVYVYSGTGAGEAQYISDFGQTNGEITPLGTWGTAPVANDLFECRRGDGLVVAAYHDAINQAYAELEDVYLTDKLDESLTLEQNRHEYTIPTGWRHLHSIEYVAPTLHWSSASYDADRPLYNTSTYTQLAQGIKPSVDILVSSIRLYLRKIGTISPARTMTLTIQTNSSGLPSGTQVTNASTTLSTSGVGGSPAFYAFTFTNPVLLAENTTYHLVLSISGTADATNHIAWCTDTDNVYADGSPATYDGATWTAVSSTTYIFSVIPAKQTALYVPVPPSNWSVIRSDGLLTVDNPVEGAAVRLIGQGQATALSADTDESTIPEGFAIAQSTALLLPQLSTRKHDQRDLKTLLAYYQNRAESLRLRARIQPRPNSRVVTLR